MNANPDGAIEAPYPSSAEAWRVIAILFIVTVFSQLDRQLPALLVAPIKAAFRISDTGFSLLQGYAFAVVYTLGGLPCGRLVDRGNRRNLIFCGIVLWSLMTAYAAFAHSYGQLFISRMGIGIGEACLAPAAYSLIADYVPSARRGRALGTYYISLAIGAGASLLAGGLILKSLPASGYASLPPWRLMFLLAGGAGLALAPLLFAVREPVRRDTGFARAAAAPAPSIREFLQHLSRYRRAYARIFGYTTVLAINGYGALAWAPAFYVRRFAFTPAQAGMVAGTAVLIAGLAGSLSSAYLSDRWLARGLPAARFRLAVLGCAITAPCVVLWPLVPSPIASIGLFGLMLYGATCAQAAAAPVLQDITPNAMRGQAIALYLLCSGLLGIGFGPTAVALMTDKVYHSEAALPLSLLTILGPLALFALWICASGIRDYALARAAVGLDARTGTAETDPDGPRPPFSDAARARLRARA